MLGSFENFFDTLGLWPLLVFISMFAVGKIIKNLCGHPNVGFIIMFATCIIILVWIYGWLLVLKLVLKFWPTVFLTVFLTGLIYTLYHVACTQQHEQAKKERADIAHK